MILSVCMPSCFSSAWLFATVRTVATRLLCLRGFSRQKLLEWVAMPSDLPNPGTEPASLMSPALSGGYFTPSATWEVDFKWIRFYFFTSPLSLLLSLLFLDSFFTIFCIVRKFEIKYPIPLVSTMQKDALFTAHFFFFFDSSNPWTWYISPSISVLFDFFHQCFIVFYI